MAVRSRISRNCSLLALMAPMALGGWSTGALAQTEEASAAETQQSSGVIVVTAQRRDESITDVPVSIGVLSPETVESFGVREVNDLALTTPSLTLNGSSGVAGEGFKVRGIGGSTLADGIEQSVSVLVDEVVTGSSGSGLLEFWDIERIEILRGPQGTLFGKNASAGVISILTADPTDVFEAGVDAEYSPTFDATRLEAHVSGPVTDNWSLRLSGFYSNQDEGFIDNPVRNVTENRGESWGVRLKSRLDLGAFRLDGSIEIFEQEQDCCARTFSFVDTDIANQSTFGRLFLSRIAANGVQPSIGNTVNISDAPIRHTNDVIHATLTPSYSFDDGSEIRAIFGYRSWEQRALTDSDMLDIDLANVFDIFRDMEVTSQELQFISPAEDRFSYILGLYHFEQRFDVDADLGTGTFLTNGVPLQTLQTTVVESENFALYGHATFEISENWDIFAGARLIRDEIEADFVSNGNFFFFPTGLRTGNARATDTNWAGTAGIEYNITDDIMVYAAASRGYKGPAIDVSISGGIANPGSDPTLEPEIVTNYELGFKSALLGGDIRLDIVTYLSNVRDFQATAFDPQTATFVLRNAGKVRSMGVEIDFSATPIEGLQTYFNLAYTDAEFVEFLGVPCTVPQVSAGSCSNAAGGQDLSGRAVNQVPELALTLGARYDFDLGSIPVFLRGDAAWQDSVISDLDLDPNTRIPSYWVANFEAGFEPFEGGVFSVWIRNAFDEIYPTRILDVAAFSGGYAQFLGIGRQVGFSFSYDY